MGVNENNLIETWVCILVFEGLKTLILGMITGSLRGKHKTFVNKEDVDKLGGGQGTVAADHPEVIRYNNCHRNEIENIGPFLCVSIAFMWATLIAYKGSSQRDPLAGIIMFTVWVAVRLIYTICYINEAQPFRTWMYMLSVLILFTIGFYAVVNVFANGPENGGNASSNG